MKCGGGSYAKQELEMELNSTMAQGQVAAVQPVEHPAPPPAQHDGRAVADAAASKTNPRPDVPMPVPASPSQTGLVSKAAIPEKEAAPKLDVAGVSAAERTLKPYGINMLPEKTDAAKQEAPPHG